MIIIQRTIPKEGLLDQADMAMLDWPAESQSADDEPKDLSIVVSPTDRGRTVSQLPSWKDLRCSRQPPEHNEIKVCVFLILISSSFLTLRELL